MTKIEINKKVVEDKIKLIELHLRRLKGLQGLSKGVFALPENFDVAAWNLRCALESVFDICAHILARIPGAKIDEYKQMALEMGRQKIVPVDFAQKTLYKMGGYRNRLTHFYFEVTPKEMHDIIQENLDVIAKKIKEVFGDILPTIFSSDMAYGKESGEIIGYNLRCEVNFTVRLCNPGFLTEKDLQHFSNNENVVIVTHLEFFGSVFWSYMKKMWGESPMVMDLGNGSKEEVCYGRGPRRDAAVVIDLETKTISHVAAFESE